MNSVFANHSKEDIMYPLTVKEIAAAQKMDPSIHNLTKDHEYTKQLVENTKDPCKEQPCSFLLLFNT